MLINCKVSKRTEYTK